MNHYEPVPETIRKGTSKFSLDPQYLPFDVK